MAGNRQVTGLARSPGCVDFDHLPELIRQLASAALCTEYDRELFEAVVGPEVLDEILEEWPLPVD